MSALIKRTKYMDYLKIKRICKYCGRHASVLETWKTVCKSPDCRKQYFRAFKHKLQA